MARLTRAVYKNQTYVFPDTFTRWSCNFADLVPATIRLPGASGGFDEYGSLPLPQETGNIQTAFMMVPNQYVGIGARRAELQTMLEAARKMHAWGSIQFWMAPDGTPSLERYFYGKITSMPLAQSADECEDSQYEAAMTIQVTDPHFYRQGSETNVLWGSAIWGNAASIWGGGGTTYAVSGLSTDISITHNGNAPAQPTLQLVCTGIQVASNPTFQILDSSGTVLQEMTWTGSLAVGDSLSINTRKYTIVKNGANGYGQLEYLTPDWILFYPGTYTLRVKLQNVGDAASLYVKFFETYV